MAFALTSQVLTLNSTDLSAYIKEATLTLSAAELDSTDFASGGWTEVESGLKSGTLSINFNDSITDNEIDEIMWGLFSTKTAFTVKQTSAAVSASNPSYSGTVLVKDYQIGGAVGSLAGKSISCTVSGAVSRTV